MSVAVATVLQYPILPVDQMFNDEVIQIVISDQINDDPRQKADRNLFIEPLFG